MMNEEMLKKLQRETGLPAEEIETAARRIATVKKIDKIVFRAETALLTELSLAYDDASLCETREERGESLERTDDVRIVLDALIKTTKNAVGDIMRGARPPEVPEFFADLAKLPDDDEAIAEHLLTIGYAAKERAGKVLKEYAEESDEH